MVVCIESVDSMFVVDSTGGTVLGATESSRVMLISKGGAVVVH